MVLPGTSPAAISSKRESKRQRINKEKKVVLVKIGGSSITFKAEKESVNHKSLDWFARTVSETISRRFKHYDEEDETDCNYSDTAFVIIHGAGSFGHHSAKEFGLSGQTDKPDTSKTFSMKESKCRKRGLSETRLSVQKLNQIVVSTLVRNGINAVSISPFGIPGLEAHAHLQEEPIHLLEKLIWRTLDAGLVPVLHGDAVLYGNDVGILSGDTIMEVLGAQSWISDAIFITDVEGVFDEDPRKNANATLLKKISVDRETCEIKVNLNASESSHEHDVTGGLKVRPWNESIVISRFSPSHLTLLHRQN